MHLHYESYKNHDKYYCEKLFKEAMNTQSFLQKVKMKVRFENQSIEQLLISQSCFCRSAHYVSDRNIDSLSDKKIQTLFKENRFEKFMDIITAIANNKIIIEEQKNNPGHHMNWWSKDKLFHFLSRAKFKNLYLSGYGQSKAPVLRETTLFDKTEPQLSIYVETKK